MAKEKKSANVITIAERALQLGMVNLKMERPSRAQKERFLIRSECFLRAVDQQPD